MKTYGHNSRTKRIFAGLLAVWMSGVVFLFCCGAPNVQAKDESCPLAKIGHCDKSSANKPAKDENVFNLEIFQDNGLAFDCCGFFPAIFNKVTTVEKSRQIAAIPVKPEIKSSALVLIKVKTSTFAAYHSPLLNQGGTYLKNKVFRI
jgi:hypothetical protein